MGVVALWLGLGGTALIASPIIIHLLSRKRYKVVEWAAMEFLLLAEKRNRKRVRLEHLILLLLRILAILLIAWAIARPFFANSNVSQNVLPGQRMHRIFILDDSPSMGQIQTDEKEKTPFQRSKSNLTDLMRQIGTDRSGDTVTLFVTSRPSEPIIAGEILTLDRITEFTEKVESLTVSDMDARWSNLLSTVRDVMAESNQTSNQELYVISDYRKHDWLAETAKKESPYAPLLQEIGEKGTGVILVNHGGKANESLDNVAITQVGLGVGEKGIVTGRATDFIVEVKNMGDQAQENIKVAFQAGKKGRVITQEIERLDAGAQEAVKFTAIFDEGDSHEVTAAVQRADTVMMDNTRYYAVEVSQGTRVLLVDGDPNLTDFESSETFFLDHAVDPLTGEITSGNLVRNVDEDEFNSTDLNDYDIIFLCNMSAITSDRAKALKRWVANGGGLVIYLGDNVVGEYYSELADAGMFPLRLEVVDGDPNRMTSVKMLLTEPSHPLLSAFGGENVSGMSDDVKFFRWWQSEISEKYKDNDLTQVLATINEQPMLVEQKLGRGVTMIINTTADVAWNNWPGRPTYLSFIQTLINVVKPEPRLEMNLPVGSEIREELDPAQYEEKVTISFPNPDATFTSKEEERESSIRDASYKEVEQGDPLNPADNTMVTRLVVELEPEQTRRRGFYSMVVNRRNAGQMVSTYAMNIPNSESDMLRAEEADMKMALSEVSGLKWVNNSLSISSTSSATRTEIWPYLLIAALLCLALEQTLGWYFGSRR